MDHKSLLKNQFLIFSLTYLAIASRHSAIQSWSMSKSQIGTDLSMNTAQLGAIDFTFLFAYAIGNFISGVLGDKYSPSAVSSIGIGLGGLTYLVCILLGHLKLANT